MEKTVELPEDVDDFDKAVTAERPGHATPSNAFAMMMASSHRAATASTQPTFPPRNRWQPVDRRNGLGEYLENPQHPRIIFQNEAGVAIWDLYPKATVHALWIPRDPTKMFRHPLRAFADPVFRATTEQHIATLRRCVAAELRNLLGRYSELEQPRRCAMDAAPPGDEAATALPPGRDWEADLLVGVHAGPSMKHLHVHVLSPDHASPAMRHRKHYNSFATPFLVRLDEFPLPQDDVRWQNDHGGYLRQDLVCWRCTKNFGREFSKFKLHLENEFDAWKTL